MPSAEIRLADYRPFPFEVSSIELSFQLDPLETRVRTTARYRRRDGSNAGDLVLNGSGLRLLSIALDGQPLKTDRFAATPDRLVIHDPPDAFELDTVVAIYPSANLSKKGLFFHPGRLVSHCEPEGFRAITYFPDRPDVLSTYTVTVEADRHAFPVLLSNGSCIAEGISGERHWRRFHDPYAKPTYIFAVMAGAFAQRSKPFRTASGVDVQLELYVDEADEGRVDFALQSLEAALAWDQSAFGLEYDSNAYRIVVLPAYAGAQENKGLNLFGSDLIVADPSVTTDEEYELIRRIVGHEAFHNWTGNRVTCRDWFQLSLKEGLTRLRDQLFTEEAIEAGVYRIDQVRALRRNQFPEDDGPAAHPVQPQAYVKIENLYTNTVYEKGAEVLRMLRTILGPARFAEALRLYLSRHDGQAVTLEELVSAMEEVGQCDLTQFRRWFVRPGRPSIEVTTDHDAGNGVFCLHLRQVGATGAGSTDPVHIPIAVALFDRHGAKISGDLLCELTEPAQSFTFVGLAEPPVASILRGFSAPVSVRPFLADDELALLALRDDDPFVAWDSLQTLMLTEVRRLAECWRAGETLTVSPLLQELFGEILDQDRGARLKALMLAVPDEPVLSEGLARIDLDAHMAARNHLRTALARTHHGTLQHHYRAQSRLDPRDLGRETVGRRMLRTATLDLLLAEERPEDIRQAFEQVRDGPSMTESFDALCALSHVDSPLRPQAFALFYARHRGSPAAVDKWFKAMALSRAPSAIDDIIALADHPDLDLRNTARTLAFFGSFFRQNRWTFHHPSGRGYGFLADRLIAADRIGVGRPSYIMAQIDQWRRYDDGRQALMRDALRRVLATPGIGSGLDEVVRRALGVEPQ